MEHLPLRTGYLLERSSEFSYRCGGCSRCCRDKAIPINPYEVARLAEHLGLSTTEALSRHTDLGGSILRPGDDGAACPFLGPAGCAVHPARPLACRLYPLGRQLTPSLDERFAEVLPHPESRGDWSGSGTVEDYLRSQDVERFILCSDRYFGLFGRMLEVMAAIEAGEQSSSGSDDPAFDNWLDVDLVVQRWCEDHQLTPPETVEARVLLHIEAIEAQLERMTAAQGTSSMTAASGVPPAT